MQYKISFNVDPQPSTNQESTAIPFISQLLNPSSVLILKFQDDGYASVYFSKLTPGAGYAISSSPIKTYKPAECDPLKFKFVLTDSSKAGLIVERTDDWINPWDEEVAHVLGGGVPRVFPYGSAPVPLPGKTSPQPPASALVGTFQAPPAGVSYSVIQINGLGRTSTTNVKPISAGQNGSVSLSFWLPAGTTGSLEVTPKGAAKADPYESGALATQVQESKLKMLDGQHVKKTILNVT